MWSRILSPVALDTALRLARGLYQRGVVMGTESPSGSTLKDRQIGATFRKNYVKSLAAFFDRLTAAGVPWRLEPCDVPAPLVSARRTWRARFKETCLVLGSWQDVSPITILIEEAIAARMTDRPDLAVEPLAVAADGLEEMDLHTAAAELRVWATECGKHPLRPEVCPVQRAHAPRSAHYDWVGHYARIAARNAGTPWL